MSIVICETAGEWQVSQSAAEHNFRKFQRNVVETVTVGDL